MVQRFFDSKKDIDAMLVVSQKNRRYFTGFDSTFGILLLTRNKNIFLTDSRYIEMAAAVENAEVRGGARASVNAMLIDAVKELGCQKIGFEDNELSVQSFERFKSLLADTNAEFVPAGDALLDLRSIKTAEEIEIMAEAQKINDQAFSRVIKCIQPDMTEIDIAVELEYQLRKFGAEGLAFDTIVASGVNTSKPHAHPTTKKIVAGDAITMDFGAKLKGYCADMTRTVFVGKPSPEMKLIYQVVLKAQQLAIKNVKAGVTGKFVDASAREVLKANGMEEFFTHGLGHGIGIDVHESISLNPNCDTVLQAGMVVTIEPGVYKKGVGGVRIEDMLIVKEDGYRNLTNSPKDLIIL